MRNVTDAELTHERLGDRFETALSNYDTQRRVDILVDHFLTDERIAGKKILDVGCGLGFFTGRLAERGADVTGCDIGPNLVAETNRRTGAPTKVADALALAETFGEESFDIIISSECIEHTPDPQKAIAEMCRVLKPGGLLSLSTPNKLWYPVVAAATTLKLRPFDGNENFSTWGSLQSACEKGGVKVIEEYGLHLFPFQFGMHGLSTWMDKNWQGLRGGMINLCVLGQKAG